MNGVIEQLFRFYLLGFSYLIYKESLVKLNRVFDWKY